MGFAQNEMKTEPALLERVRSMEGSGRSFCTARVGMASLELLLFAFMCDARKIARVLAEFDADIGG